MLTFLKGILTNNMAKKIFYVNSFTKKKKIYICMNFALLFKPLPLNNLIVQCSKYWNTNIKYKQAFFKIANNTTVKNINLTTVSWMLRAWIHSNPHSSTKFHSIQENSKMRKHATEKLVLELLSYSLDIHNALKREQRMK